jgi:O-succinylbenzoate synthase
MPQPSPDIAEIPMTPIFPGIRIEAAELRLVRLPLLTPFVISTGTMTEKVFPLLTLRAEGLEGYAEGVMDLLPDYLEETQAGALPFLREAVLPQIVGRRFASPAELGAILNPWRGHKMSKAMVEMAVWDLWAKALGLPLSAALGGTRDAVEVGVSLGIADIPRTLERVREANDAGYRRIKLKIKRGHDLDLLAAVRADFPKVKLTVDANTDYRLNDLPLLKAMDAFGLDYIEQPLAFDDIQDHARVQAHLLTALCLDESIRSAASAALPRPARSTIFAPPSTCRSGAAACWNRGSAGRRTSIWQRCPISPSPATRPPPAAISGRISSMSRLRRQMG